MNEIRVSAFLQLHQPSTCKFLVEGRDLLPGRSVEFASAGDAASSELAKRLFAEEGILHVRLVKNAVMVTKKSPDDWAPAAKTLGKVIKETMALPEPPVSPDAGKALMADDEIAEKVKDVLDSEVAEAVGMHGGTISLIDVKDGNVFLKMGGSCQGCAQSTATLKQGVERALRSKIPDIGDILDTTDHAAGQNPYYSASS